MLTNEVKDISKEHLGYIESGTTGLARTEAFWGAIHAILWVAYVKQTQETANV